MMRFDNRLSEAEQATKWWWVFLVTGILWLIVSLIIFRFDITSVGAVCVLIGCIVIVAGVNEFLATGVTQGGWRWVHIVLGILGIFLPFLWLIGALLPAKRGSRYEVETAMAQQAQMEQMTR